MNMMQDGGGCPADHRAGLEEILARHARQSAHLPLVIQQIYDLLGHVPDDILPRVADVLQVSLADVYATVYQHLLARRPAGRHVIYVCEGTSCYLRGSRQILEEMVERLGIQPGETTPDGLFSLEIGRCFGACALGPVVVVDQEVYPRMEPSKVAALLEKYRQEAQASCH
ncbi:MAG: NADH-quinone oxidoreductase subunit NuoE family protein [Desulfurispora sp.]|uniref:NADH-quinone oxidoreductase subunit NuoE family protein n=1 Tax=Desulfurispora sp. TaxID=3014275 RepID=UPI00404983DE